jgi:hypothetical protein
VAKRTDSIVTAEPGGSEAEREFVEGNAHPIMERYLGGEFVVWRRRFFTKAAN